ncbi:MAG: hypothetical protein K6E76_00520 [Patescibacteria group bacterium]|nr:hypothetical protein [Patescibacteria group bacterium]
MRRFLIEAGFGGKLNCAEIAETILHTMKNENSVNIDDILNNYYITTETRKFCEINDEYNEESDAEWNNRDSIYETLFAGTKRKYGIITIFNQDKQSIHLAFIDCDGNYYDQQEDNGPITEAGHIEDLLANYKQN